MRKKINWQVKLCLVLMGLSFAVYTVHYLIFRDLRHIFIYLIGDLGFVFIEVMLVTVIIHQLLVQRERERMLEKQNMAIGTFFSEVGESLLKVFVDIDGKAHELRESLAVRQDLTEQNFSDMLLIVEGHNPELEIDKYVLAQLKGFLKQKRDFLLNLLANPNLLEHESFTNLLWTVFHLGDELAHREDTSSLPPTDMQHLAGDIKRSYSLLTRQWLSYIRHLKKSYPYLFSLAVRTNPFNPAARVEVI